MTTLAAAQTTPLRGDVAANLAQHLELIEVAASQDADVLVFPELSLTGYELDLAASLAFTADDPRLTPLAEAAQRHAMTLVVGAPVRIDARLHLGALIMGSDGGVCVYTKRRLGTFSSSARVDLVDEDSSLPPGEPTVFEPGTHDPEVWVGARRAAVAVCADVGDPRHAAAAAERGAALYLASMFVTPSELARELDRLRDRARRHRLTVVFSNPGGPTGRLRAGGSSAILTADGRAVAQLPAHGAGVIAVTDDGHGNWSHVASSV